MPGVRKARGQVRRKARNGTALQTELARQILSRIESDRLEPGAAIRELPLAKAFGVSRTPIRAALMELRKLGFLDFRAGAGFALKRAVSAAEIGDEARLPRSEIDRLYEAILEDRARDALPAEVSEAALMPRYGASRGTIRRVLMRLSDEGLARRQRGHGWRFVEALDSLDALAESYRFRIIVECAALREPTFKADPGTLRRMKEAHRAIVEHPEGLEPRRWFEVNSTFHETLTLWSHNRFLIEAVRRQNTLRRFSEYHAFAQLPGERVEQSTAEHLAILEAIEAGDIEWAATLLHRHLSLAERDYTEPDEAPVRASDRSASGRRAPSR